MDLKALRQEFADKSGFLDSVNPDGSDNGADFYINSGQRYLDKLVEKRRDIGRYFTSLSVGDYFVTVLACRVIQYVGIGDSSDWKWLTRKNLVELREEYEKPIEYVSNGTPKYFAPAYMRPYNPTDSDLYGIIIAPPTDQAYDLEIWGKVFSEDLSNDGDKSFWTRNYPDLLIMAAQRQLEAFFRNTQGVQDWTTVIRSEVLELGKDFIEEEYFDIDQMEG